jgi:hypothetical protein
MTEKAAAKTAIKVYRVKLAEEDDRLAARRAEIRAELARVDAFLGVDEGPGTARGRPKAGLSRRVVDRLAADQAKQDRRGEPPGMTAGMLAAALGIEEGSSERQALTREIRALKDAKVIYRSAGGRYRLPRSK